VRSSERLPSFTTPTPIPQTPSIDTKEDGSDRLTPLPPTNLPVEDYASPLLHTASFFSNLFRYSVYGSVGIVTLAITSLIGVHLYVEHVALASPTSESETEEEEDVEEWLISRREQGGWSGKHLGNGHGGGTDPKLGLLARAAIRGAWISINWNSGSAASPISTTTTNTSHFSVPGPRMIGQEENLKSLGTTINDSGWLIAEQYLVYALSKVEKEKGFSLLEPRDWEFRIDKGGVDRSIVELEERLCELREKLGGRLKLELAREGWERIYNSLNQNPTTDTSTTNNLKLIEWEQREKLLAARKLGELGVRIAELWGGKDSEQGRIEIDRAKDWFVRGLVPVLQSSPLPISNEEERKKHVSPISSFFSFWSRSHPPSTTDTNSELSLISTSSTCHLPPSTLRSILTSLISFETFFARTLSDLKSAQLVQESALNFAKTSFNNNNTTTSLRPSNLSQVSKLVTEFWLATRISILETHLTECKIAQNNTKTSRGEALKDLNRVRDRIQSLLINLPPSTSENNSKEVATTKLNGLNGSGVDKKTIEIFNDQLERIRKDAIKVDSIAKGLINFLERE